MKSLGDQMLLILNIATILWILSKEKETLKGVNIKCISTFKIKIQQILFVILIYTAGTFYAHSLLYLDFFARLSFVFSGVMLWRFFVEIGKQVLSENPDNEEIKDKVYNYRVKGYFVSGVFALLGTASMLLFLYRAILS